MSGGPLDPPGSPGSTRSDAEPREPIPPTGWDGSFPIVIGASGSYYLTREIVGDSGQSGILISATNQVTIDLNGFTLTGVNGSVDGIVASAGTARITVRNGTIAGWNDDGIDLRDSTNVRVEDVVLRLNSGSGIEIGTGIVQDCVVQGPITGVVGVRSAGPAQISNCVTEGYGTGIALDGGGLLRDCVVDSAELTGIFAGPRTSVENCRVNNTGSQFGHTVYGISANGAVVIRDSVIDNSFAPLEEDAAIRLIGIDNVVTGNLIRDYQIGIKFENDASNSMVYGNHFQESLISTYIGSNSDDDVGPVRPYFDQGAWDQRLNTLGADPCNTQRFHCVLNDEAVLDHETGLVWQRTPGSTTRNHFGANQDCSVAVDTGGRRGWRLPTIDEIMTLMTAGIPSTIVSGGPFPSPDANGLYWTASSTAFQFPETAYAIDFGSIPFTVAEDKNVQHRFWCVRGGEGYDETYGGTP